MEVAVQIDGSKIRAVFILLDTLVSSKSFHFPQFFIHVCILYLTHQPYLLLFSPNGEGGWSTGPKSSDTCQWDDFQCPTDPDEGDFIASIIQEVKDRGANGNIYAIGNSNGAALAHRLASNADSSLPIKGIVTKVTQLLKSPERSGPGTLNYNQPSSVRGSQKVSVLSIMGTEDGLIPYEGGSSSVFGGNDNFQLMSAMESMNTWAIHNGCSGEYEMSQHVSDQGDLTATKYTYGSCPSDVIVEH